MGRLDLRRLKNPIDGSPFRMALAVSAAFAFVFWLIFGPQFEADDDVMMMSLANGWALGHRSADLVFTNPLVGVLISGLYGVSSVVAWYPAYLYLLHSVALIAAIYMAFRRPRFRVRPHFFLLLAVLAVCYLQLWMHLSFTSVAVLLGVTGVLLHATNDRVTRFPVAASVLAGSLLGVAALVRFAGFGEAVALGLPVLVFTMRRLSVLQHVAFGLAAALIVMTGVVFQSIRYSDDASWDQYQQVLAVRDDLIGKRQLENVESVPGWSTNDLDLFGSFFFFTEPVHNLESLESLNRSTQDTITVGQRLGMIVSGSESVLYLQGTSLLVLAGLLILGYSEAAKPTRAALIVTTAVAVLVLVYLAATQKVPRRVVLPLLTYLALVYIVLPESDQPATMNPELSTQRRHWSTIVTALVLSVGGIVLVYYLGPSSVQNREEARELVAVLDDLGEQDERQVVWAGALGLQRMMPTRVPDLPEVNLIWSGWVAGSPQQREVLDEFNVADVYLAIAGGEAALLARKNQDIAAVERYLDEHYQIRVEMTPVKQLGVDQRVTVFRASPR